MLMVILALSHANPMNFLLTLAPGVGLYLEAAMINHSCRPTCVQTFVKETLYIRSFTDIPEGGEITIAYIDVARPTWYRRKLLSETYGFVCNCIACSIASEEEYWLHQGCKGYLKQSSAASTSQFTSWRAQETPTSKDDADDMLTTLLPLPSRKDKILVCTCCSEVVHKSTLDGYGREISRSFEASRFENNSSEKLAAMLEAYEKTVKYITDGSYAQYEILSALCMHLLSMGMFREALVYSQKLCSVAYGLYPDGHPQVSIFNLQHAKLLRYLYGDSNSVDAVRYFEKAYNSLKNSHHPTHRIFNEF